MKTSAQILVVCSVALCAGCGGRKSGPASSALVDQLGVYGGPEAARLRVGAGHAAQKQAAREIALPGAVRGTGWHIPWYAPDPKNPTALRRRVMVADAKQGAMDSKIVGKQNVVTIHLRDVHATFYNEGKPSATIDAPFVTTNERDRVIIATGGVTIHSLLDPTAAPRSKPRPSDSTVQADKVVWDSHTTQVVCTGNTRLIIHRQPAADDISSQSNRILYDTEKRTFVAE